VSVRGFVFLNKIILCILFRMQVIKIPIVKSEVQKMAEGQFGDMIKAVVDVEQEIMVVGPELHADGETLLMEDEHSKRANTWGINLYPKNKEEDFVEFDSMVNIKPALGNRSRSVQDETVQNKIREIVKKLILP